MGYVLSQHFRWVQRSAPKPQSLYKHIPNTQRRKWRGAFTWFTWDLWKKKKKSGLKQYKYTVELCDPNDWLGQHRDNNNDCLAAAGAGRSLLCSACADKDKWGQRQLAFSWGKIWRPSFRHGLVLYSGLKWLLDCYIVSEWSNPWLFCHIAMTAIQLLFSLNEQKYLRRFYGLPAGLQGRQRTSDAFQDKIKDMQRFFNLKVSRCA